MSTPLIVDAACIREAVEGVDFAPVMEAAFARYSEGKAIVPPVGELLFRDPPGEVHIKYGYVVGDDHYVVKIASGFPGNVDLGLPNSDGLMLLFRRQTGEFASALLDGGYLTDVRTAAAGAVAAKHLAPSVIRCIGIIGTGTQARLQLRALKSVTVCREVHLWGRNAESAQRCRTEMERDGFRVSIATGTREIAQACDLIVTTTASQAPLLLGVDLRPGTHVTAMGSDTREKRELDSEALARADLVVADSISQCIERGEISHALREHALQRDDVVELGAVISGAAAGRTKDEQITIADLTGVAVQDCAIAAAVYETIVRRTT